MKMFLTIVFVLVSLALVKGVWGRPAADDVEGVWSRPAADDDQDVEGTQSNEDGMGFFFRPRFGKREVLSTETTVDQAGFFFKHKGKRSADVEDSTESSEDGVGFFFRPKFGKRSSGEEDSTDSSEDGAAFFFRPKFGRRSAGNLRASKLRRLSADLHQDPEHMERRSADVEDSTESSEDGVGFFFRPRFGKRAVGNNQY